jgi:hypothetical protein
LNYLTRSTSKVFCILNNRSFVVAQAIRTRPANLSGEVKWMNGWSAMAVFEGEFSNVTTSYAGKAVARYAW